MSITQLWQPDGSPLCGQTCIAMAAGVSLDRAIEAVGHSRGTQTRHMVAALRALGVPCADRLKRISRTRPIFPKRGILAINRPPGTKRPDKWHWLLTWDGTIYDPAGVWPDYVGWRVTSFLEIRS